MGLKIIIIILFAALVTACVSGVFGMAGGLIFMGVIASFMGVAEAMVVHGAVQSVSNSFRAFLLREHVRWDVLAHIAIGAVPVFFALFFLHYIPNKGVLFLVLGLLPVLLWLPRTWIRFDAQRRRDAVLCGFFLTGLNLMAGVAGPALDLFFIKTDMSHKQIVATKAITMFASHLMKIVYFGLPMLRSGTISHLPPWWFFIAVVPFILAGTFTGTRILHYLKDDGFKSTTKYLVSAIGVVYVWRAAGLLGWL